MGASATATKGTQWLTIKLKDVDIAGISILTDWINPQKTTTDYVLGLGQLYTDSGATGFHVMVTAISVAPPTARLCITPP